jgi:phosphotransferase system HPr-like phosphotransfer protein
MAIYDFRRRMAFIHQEGMDQLSPTHPETAGPAHGSKFSEKIGIFSNDFLKCTVYLAGLSPSHARFTQKFYSTLASSSTLLEDFLDYHGAKNNKDWYLFRELTAGMRHIGLASNFQKHISNRLRYYDLPDSADFESEGEASLRFLNQCLQKMAPMALNEAQRLGIRLPGHRFEDADFPSIQTTDLLEYDIDDENRHQQKQSIVKIASEFLNLVQNFDQIKFYERYSYQEILGIVPDKVNEVEVRRYEMLVHNLQSSFDTYVIHGGFRFGNRKLKQLRGFFSVVFHLLQMVGRLLHFFERHLYEAGYKNTYKRVQDDLAMVVSPERLLDCTINYGLYYVCHFFALGKEHARVILNENIERGQIRVGVPQKLGFHARPSLLVAKIVQYYGGQVELVVGDDRFDASSVLDIQWAGGKIQKENLKEVVFEGDARTLKDIEILAAVNYGEDLMGKGVPLPKELKYLR